MKTIDRLLLYVIFIMVLMLVLSDVFAQNVYPDTIRMVWPDSNGWIDVRDSLPCTRDKYLVHIRRCDSVHKDDCMEFMQAVFYYPRSEKDDDPASGWATWYMRIDEYHRYTVKVTHWQPLPPKPKDK